MSTDAATETTAVAYKRIKPNNWGTENMYLTEAAEASTERAENTDGSRVKTGDCEAMTRNQKKKWAKAQRKQMK